jgi:putative DNA primase/helicase
MLQSRVRPSIITARVESHFRDGVRAAARDKWHWVASRCGAPVEALSGLRTKCPACDSDYFKFLDERGGGSFVCRGAGRADVTGDGFALLRHLFGLTFDQAVRMAAEVTRVTELAMRRRA